MSPHCFDKIDGSRQSPEGENYLYRELKNNLDWKRKIKLKNYKYLAE